MYKLINLCLLYIFCSVSGIVVFIMVRLSMYDKLSETYDISSLPVLVGMRSLSFNNAIVAALTVSIILILD
jgi:hypothetical protein